VKLHDLLVPKTGLAKARELEGRVYHGEAVHAEVERRAKDGTNIPVRVSAAAVPGAAAGELLVLYEDISEQRRAQRALEESEGRLRQVIDSNIVGIAFGDANGTVIDANDEYLRIVGSTRDELVARRVNFLKAALPDADTNTGAGAEPHPNATATGASQLWEKEITRPDGTIVPVVVGMAALDQLGENGIAIMLDITSRKRAEEVTRQARDLAEQAVEARSMFLANMSHEIRTPMNAVLGMVELVMDTELTREQRHSLEVVRGSAESLLGILNDILDYSKIEAERLELETIPFDLPRLVHSVTSLLALRAREKHIELIADVSADTPDIVAGDPTRVRQILTNLVGNAIKFTDEGEVVVSVRPVRMDDGRDAVRFSVRDTGIGIPPNQIDRIFAEFTQADASMSRQYGGTGLGLAIVRRLVNLMGGKLGVTSKPSQGSDFSFTLPLPVESARADSRPDTGLGLAGRRILVVDDNATNRGILREMLSSEGARVAEATGSVGALGALRTAQEEGNPIAIAVVDIQMPGVDGFELASMIRADPTFGTTRLLMLTSAGQRGDGARCRTLGLDGYLTKPTSRVELLEGVAAVLGGRGSTGIEGQVVTRHSLAEARQSLRILLAEDVLVNQEVAATMLRKRGHYVDVAGNGREAVEAAAKVRYDVILMDIQMPDMDGFAATAAIRATEAGRELPIVALTAHALSGERERCVALGMNDHLGKPFKAHELFATVERWGTPLARARAEAGLRERISTPDGVETARRPVARVAASPHAPDASSVDIEALREQLREADAEDALDAIVDTFLDSVPERVETLCGLLASGSPPDIARAAHALKSSVGAIGARALALTLAGIESSANSDSLHDRTLLASQVHAAATAVLDDLRAYRQGSKA
jgi:PAS domain S-box-containing protein